MIRLGLGFLRICRKYECGVELHRLYIENIQRIVHSIILDK